MNIWQSLTKRFKNDPRPNSQSILSLYTNSCEERPTDPASLIARNRSWTWRCVGINSQTVAAVPLRLYVRGGTRRYPTRGDGEVQEVTAHPLLDLLARANDQITGRELMELTVSYLELLGNSYWYIEKPAIDPATWSIYPLMAQHVKIIPDQSGRIASYEYGSGQNKQVLKPEDIIHFRYNNPADPHYGMGPLQAAVGAHDRMQSMGNYQQALFDNNARPDFALIAKNGISADEQKRLSESWKQKYGGARNSGKPAILSGEVEVQPLSYDPTDTGLLEFARLSREEIAYCFGVPMTMIEISASRAEAETHRLNYLSQTIAPKLSLIQETLNERLLPLFDDSGRSYIEYTEIIPEDREAERRAIDTYVRAGVMTANEARSMLGLPPIDGGDELRITSEGNQSTTEPN